MNVSFMMQVEDSESVLMTKCDQLADCIKSAKYVVVYTGAGISTVSMLLTDFVHVLVTSKQIS